uniref:Uncharacterized protein n=1 Tax=Steinernema glaseri TaxID=37863 RepID=A0A1I8ALX3_9BILA
MAIRRRSVPEVSPNDHKDLTGSDHFKIRSDCNLRTCKEEPRRKLILYEEALFIGTGNKCRRHVHLVQGGA